MLHSLVIIVSETAENVNFSTRFPLREPLLTAPEKAPHPSYPEADVPSTVGVDENATKKKSGAGRFRDN